MQKFFDSYAADKERQYAMAKAGFAPLPDNPAYREKMMVVEQEITRCIDRIHEGPQIRVKSATCMSCHRKMLYFMYHRGIALEFPCVVPEGCIQDEENVCGHCYSDMDMILEIV